jgi:hypothetical protein
MLQAGRRMPFSIQERDGHIVVNSPYHPNFPARARGLGGEWDAVRHVWVFDAAEQDRVTALCREIYGADGTEGGKDRSAPFPNAPARGRNSNQFAEGAARPHYYGHDRLRERMMAAGADTLPDAPSQPIDRSMRLPRRLPQPLRDILRFTSIGAIVGAAYGHMMAVSDGRPLLSVGGLQRGVLTGVVITGILSSFLLEMLLFAAYQRGDVKPLAKNLLAKLGGFGEVMAADPDALSEAGLNLAGIAAIKAGREAALRLMRTELQQGPVVNSWDKLIDYCNAKSPTTRSRSSTSCFSTARMYCSSTSASSAARSTIPRSTLAKWSSARSNSAPRP